MSRFMEHYIFKDLEVTTEDLSYLSDEAMNFYTFLKELPEPYVENNFNAVTICLITEINTYFQVNTNVGNGVRVI